MNPYLSTQAIVVFIQDAGAGMSKLPLNRFKCRQYSTGGNLSILDRYARKIFYCIGLIYQILKHLIFPIVRNSYSRSTLNSSVSEIIKLSMLYITFPPISDGTC